MRERYADCGPTLGELNIDILCANSPQAKGRVERAHQTLQDRLVKELRLRAISTQQAANAWAPSFIADYNRRFACAPRSSHDAHRPVQPTDDLKQVLQWKERRMLTQNPTVHYQRSLYLLEDTPQAQALRGRTVDVYETDDGVVRIRFDQTEPAPRPSPRTVVCDSRTSTTTSTSPRSSEACRRPSWSATKTDFRR